MIIKRYDSNNRPPKIIHIGVDTSAPNSTVVSDGKGGQYDWMKVQQDAEKAARRRQDRLILEREDGSSE